MYTKIDWLSFTVRFEIGEGETENSVLEKGIASLLDLFDGALDAIGTLSDFRWAKGRKHYTASLVSADNGIHIFVNPRSDHILFELSGRACDQLALYPRAVEFLDAIKGRLTRLDVAADMLTETTPHEFLEEGWSKRFSSHSTRKEQSGTTIYVGSRESNRFARIYRYNPPHERSHLLRCEWQLAKHDAESTARSILSNGIDATVKALGEQFGWKHEDWKPDTQDSAILSVWRPERAKGKTVFWLSNVVAPLLVRMTLEDGFDAKTWFAENVLVKIDPTELPFL